MDPKDLLRRLMAQENLNPNALASKTQNKTKQPQIHRFLTGEAKEPKRSTWEPVAKYFGVPVDAFFDPKVAEAAAAAKGLIGKASSRHSPHPVAGVAHEMRPEAITVPLLTAWGELMSLAVLPHEFRIAAPDDALAPTIVRGTELIFATGDAPRPGQVVLVRDRVQALHLRRYTQGADGNWQARAPNQDYLTLDAERDGLVLLAALRWVSGEGY